MIKDISKTAERLTEIDYQTKKIFARFYMVKTNVCELSFYELRIISEIADLKVASLKVLSERLKKKNSWLSEKVDLLVNKGFIVRRINKNDRRCNDIFLTKKGIDCCNKISGLKKEFFCKILKSMENEETRNRFIDAMEVLYSVAKTIKKNK